MPSDWPVQCDGMLTVCPPGYSCPMCRSTPATQSESSGRVMSVLCWWRHDHEGHDLSHWHDATWPAHGGGPHGVPLSGTVYGEQLGVAELQNGRTSVPSDPGMTDLDKLRKLEKAADDDADALLAAWGPVIGGDCSYDRLDALNGAIVHAARSLVAMRNALSDLLAEVERLRTCLLACHNAMTPTALREVHMHLSVDGHDDAAGEWAMRAMYNAAADPEEDPE